MLMVLNCQVPIEVSTEDFDYLSGYLFTLDKDGYPRCSSRGKHFNDRLSRIVVERMGYKDFDVADHKDHNLLNNKRDNLRPATNSQNMMNRQLHRNNTSGHPGVYWTVTDGVPL